MSKWTLVFASLFLLACGPDRTLYTGGPILTVDAEDRVVEALGVEGDRIAFVGSRAEGEAWAGPVSEARREAG